MIGQFRLSSQIGFPTASKPSRYHGSAPLVITEEQTWHRFNLVDMAPGLDWQFLVLRSLCVLASGHGMHYQLHEVEGFRTEAGAPRHALPEVEPCSECT